MAEGNNMAEEIGIKLARDLEAIEDERIEWNARIEAYKCQLNDYRAVIYRLASQLFPNHKVSSVAAVFGILRNDRPDNVVKDIDQPDELDMPLHHVEVKFEI